MLGLAVEGDKEMGVVEGTCCPNGTDVSGTLIEGGSSDSPEQDREHLWI